MHMLKSAEDRTPKMMARGHFISDHWERKLQNYADGGKI